MEATFSIYLNRHVFVIPWDQVANSRMLENRVSLQSTLEWICSSANYIAFIRSVSIKSNSDVRSLTISARQIKTSTCANSVDPDETARNEPSHQELHCLPSGLDFKDERFDVFCFQRHSVQIYYL